MSSLAAFAASLTSRVTGNHGSSSSSSSASSSATAAQQQHLQQYQQPAAAMYEFIKDRLYFTSLPAGAPRNSSQTDDHYFSVDNELVYMHFYNDFGPNNMSHVYRFVAILNAKFANAQLFKKRIVLYTSMQNDKRANAAYMMCCYMMLVHGQTPDEAWKPLADLNSQLVPYRDAGYGPATYFLTVLDSLRGLYRALKKGLFDFKNFDLADYEYFEKVEHGDMNWVLPGKFLAFATPHDETSTEYSRLYSPYGPQRARIEDTIAYFKAAGVTTVVRLNNKTYDRQKFLDAGINHVEMYFPDGSTPPDSILYEFLDLAERTEGKIAIHCKAGLGRTGSLIAAYIMKHHHFTASEVISWLRVMRPGSVVGPQQNYLQAIQTSMWKLGPLTASRGAGLNASESEYTTASGGARAHKSSRVSARTAEPTAELAAVALVDGREMSVPVQPRKGTVDAAAMAAQDAAIANANAMDYTDSASTPRYFLRSASKELEANAAAETRRRSNGQVV